MLSSTMLWLVLVLTEVARAAPWTADPAPVTTSESGLQLQDTVVGDGAEVARGAEVSVHYVGMLEDGAVFDTSRDRGQPFGFRVGDGMVIAGWDEGLVGMRVGGTRRLVVPAAIGYGDRGSGPIPPGATLFFEIELLGLVPPRAAPLAPSEVPAEAFREVPDVPGVRVAELTAGSGKRVKRGGRVCIDWAMWTAGVPGEHTYARRSCTWYRLDDGDLPPLLEGTLTRMREGGRRQVVGPGEPVTVVEVELHGVGK